MFPRAQEYTNLPAVAHSPERHLQVHKDCGLPHPSDRHWGMVCTRLGSHQWSSCIRPRLGVWTSAEAYADCSSHAKPTLQRTSQGPFASTCRHYCTAVQM